MVRIELRVTVGGDADKSRLAVDAERCPLEEIGTGEHRPQLVDDAVNTRAAEPYLTGLAGRRGMDRPVVAVHEQPQVLLAMRGPMRTTIVPEASLAIRNLAEMRL